ncbi:hypothetical protein L1049_006345 [Liquidambar formosana]|uniref:Uncharacterized protein n=1 Tax=Liquidambar formosana TaxID=63359 RepID=A0AAP0RER5_LIQFO
MVREWKLEVASGYGGSGSESLGNGIFILWVGLITLSLISAIIFSCADGASRDKASATQTDTYGTNCGGCGAACGG